MRTRTTLLGPLMLVLVLAGLTVRPGPEAGGAFQVSPGDGASPVTYTFSFPEPEHRWMEVEASFPDLGSRPLELRMSRSSPGRYALHEFAKNVFDVRLFDGRGAPREATRPDLHQWTVAGHDGEVQVRYKVFGDRVDGTYLAVDATHAHINMPAALMWARGLGDRPAVVRFEQPPDARWRVATQLLPTDDPLAFTAPNLSYLLDSPVEFSAHAVRTFELRDTGGRSARFRIALHHHGTDRELDTYAADVERIAREELAIMQELPEYEGGTYTFLADYLPYASGDGMEHRNSTVLTSAGALGNPGQRLGLLGTVAHELFHGWNVERIRPRSLEPFDFERANVSGELWLAEGFTSYYDSLVLQRAGLADLESTARELARLVNTVSFSPGRQWRSAVEMSRLAPFVDAARSVDPTYWQNTFISYYTGGAALGLALDLTLRDRSESRVTLDHYMRALWKAHGAPPPPAPGLVARPYTGADARAVLGEVAGDEAFARDFFSRFIEGREVPDYARLLARAGFLLRPQTPGRAWLGDVRLAFEGAGARLTEAAPFGSPIYGAGLDRGDLLVAIDGREVGSADRLEAALGSLRPGARVPVTFVRRDGADGRATLTLGEDPRYELVLAERAGGRLGDRERRFREAWLGSGTDASRPQGPGLRPQGASGLQ